MNDLSQKISKNSFLPIAEFPEQLTDVRAMRIARERIAENLSLGEGAEEG